MARPSKAKDYINKLWNAASQYEFEFISGSAIGLVTKGVLEDITVAKEIAQWQHNIWSLYHTRKAALESEETLTEEMLDFSGCGPIPYSVSDLMQAVSVV